jgi:hypothetical protein
MTGVIAAALAAWSFSMEYLASLRWSLISGADQKMSNIAH